MKAKLDTADPPLSIAAGPGPAGLHFRGSNRQL